MQCPQCQTPNPDGAKFCSECGSRLAVACAQCGADLPPAVKFCPECGRPVAAPRPAAPPGPAVAALSADVLQRLIPQEYAERLLATRGRPGTERRLVTILFSDVKGSTPLAEQLDPEDFLEIMNGAFEFLIPPVYRHEGTLANLMGDAILAFFGTPLAHEDDPERAIRAALEIQQGMQGYAERLARERRLKGFAVRVGINTGLVAAGEVGSDLRVQYTAMGDAVNLAARMEQNAPPGGILIAHDTYRHVRGVFDVQPQPPLAVKGKAEPVQTYLVLRAKPRAFRTGMRGVEGVETRMIGRDRELSVLQDALRAAIEDRELQAVTVVGEPGVGKSRLLYEFDNWLELLPERVRVFQGRASQELGRLPFGLLRDVLAARFEILDGEPPAAARDKLERGAVGLMTDDAEAAMKAHFIGQLIGLDFSASPYLRGILDDAKQIHDRAFHYLTQFFAAAAGPPGLPPVPPTGGGEKQVAGAVLLLEDLHWADGGSLDAVAHLMAARQDVPLLVLGLARPELFERRPKWGEGVEAHARIDLPPLSKRDSRRLVAEILQKAPEVPEALRDLVVSSCEGNPFYAEELVKTLVEAGVIVPGEETWQVEAGRLAKVQVPPTLLGVLQVRLDRLAAPERETLQQASVVGRVFWDQMVASLRAAAEDGPRPNPPPLRQGREPGGRAAVSPLPAGGMGGARVAAELGEALAQLRRKELILGRETSAFAGAGEYVFTHALLREATYETVLKRQRRVYHARAAVWLIEKSGERAAEYAGLIGEHYERAGEAEQAAEWYGRAGQQADRAYATQAAEEYYRRALALAEECGLPEARKIDWYEGLAGRLSFHWEEQAEAYGKMLAVAESAGEAVAQAKAWKGLAGVKGAQGDHRGALELLERAEAIAREAGEAGREQLGYILTDQSYANYPLGDAARAAALAERALAVCDTAGDTETARRLRMVTLNRLGTAHGMVGHMEQEEACYAQALAVARELDDRNWAARTLTNLGENARLRGDHATAVARLAEALSIAESIGASDRAMMCLSNLGGARAGLGQYAAAEADLRTVIERVGWQRWFALGETYRFLAEACLGQGKLGEALAAARQALALSQEYDQVENIGQAWRVLGEISGQWPESSGQWSVASGQQPEVGAQLNCARTPGREAGVEEALPDPATCFAESVRVFEEIGNEPERAQALRAWARYERAHGDREKGEAMWRQARAIFARHAMPLQVERMDREEVGLLLPGKSVM